MKPLTLRAQLTVFYTVALAVLVTGLSIAYYRMLARQLDLDATADLNDRTSAMHGFLRIEDGTPTLVYDASDPDQVAFIDTVSRYYQVYDAVSGRLLAQSPALQPLGVAYTPDEVQSFRDHPRLVDIVTDRGRIRLSNSLMTPRAGEKYLLQVGVSLNGFDAALDRFLTLIYWSGPATVLIVLVTGRWMAGRALAPLARLADAARTISVADLEQRLPVRGAGDELDRVAHAFNHTLARLERSVGEMKGWSAAIAHELRTPLAALRGETELALMRPRSPARDEQTLVDQLEEFDRLARLITQILTLARAEAGEIPLAAASVDLAALVRTVVDQMEPIAQPRGVSLACGEIEPVTVRGDAGWLERLLLNLIDNAIKFTHARGSVLVTLKRDDDRARLVVTDTGIGIDAAALPHVFERFYRVDTSRSSSAEGIGLGLALAKWIVDQHHGRISVSSRPGEGTTLAVELPMAGGDIAAH